MLLLLLAVFLFLRSNLRRIISALAPLNNYSNKFEYVLLLLYSSSNIHQLWISTSALLVVLFGRHIMRLITSLDLLHKLERLIFSNNFESVLLVFFSSNFECMCSYSSDGIIIGISHYFKPRIINTSGGWH